MLIFAETLPPGKRLMKADGRGLIRFWNYQLTNKITTQFRPLEKSFSVFRSSLKIIMFLSLPSLKNKFVKILK